MKKQILTLLTLLLILCSNVSANMIHAIVFANTLDEEIGCDADVKRVKNEIGKLTQYIGYDR